MNQKHLEELISSYIDDELTDDERAVVEVHLKSCSECRALMEELNAIKNTIFSVYRSVEVPFGVEQQVLSVIDRGTLKGPISIQISWAALASFSLILIITLSVLSPVGVLGLGLASSVLNILFSLLKAIPVIIQSVPYVFITVSAFSVIVMLISIWSLRRLLLMRESV